MFQEKLISIADLDLIFLPLVVFDKRGNRLGRGAGYYDRALAPLKDRAFKKPVLVGIAYNFQKINKIPIEKWDVPLNFVITEKTTYQF
ncbi:5-formyltetrahydrofolate cyclo-ligase [Coxiella-like endosymbiont of Rhipicephalus sanguineus]|uniref:5-formyltetrahydrofolate cyclo-ligase n=1 Tax=Coxiella-like endosymbiont of Rhipicephalus sanguineus TaxID=1955402 RepID=UPI0027E0B61C|nr:5-formyltetrahydrofolate cyclo-ligase [Coxiella-like endosymbiont of Rhipicephalus sanguineus]